MGSLAKTIFTLRWQPGRDTVTALVTAVAMVPVYYLGVHGRGNLVGVAGFVILGNGILNVLFPAYYLLVYRREEPAELGLTHERLWLALGLSAVCSALFWPRLATEMQLHPSADLVPHLLFNGLSLWGPLFVFGWLQLRLERAFGILPGVVIAAVCFGAFHLGTFPVTGVGSLILVGLFYAVLFRIPKNLLAVWPLAWTAGNSIGTLRVGLLSGWAQALIYGILLLAQILGIAWMVRARNRPAEAEKARGPWLSPSNLFRRGTSLFGSLLVVWAASAYVMLPAAWRSFTRRHPALDEVPRVTRTANGIPGDPLNVALVGTEEEIQQIMLMGKWLPADPITLRSSLRIAAGTVFRRSYETAPVSNLFLWGRKQDLAFEQPIGGDPRQRHHVRFWRSGDLDEDGRPLWIGAATFDRAVGLSHTTGQITHHIDADVDAERNKLMDDLNQTGLLSGVYWLDDFHDKREGRNGGGDRYYTDGRLAVGVAAIGYVPLPSGPVEAAEEGNQDEQSRQLLVGTWEDDYQGKRRMTLKEDGTGTMVVELSGLKASLFASRLRFDMLWSVANGRLKKRTVGGEPEAQVRLILKTMGDEVDEPILELTEGRLLLLDRDGKTKYDWRRVATGAGGK
jgi:hypothetical protein